MRFLILGLGVVVLLGLGLLLYRGSRVGESRVAVQEFQNVWQTYLSGNYQLAANDFRRFRDQYRRSEYGDDATLYLADSYFRAGDYRSAIEVLESFEEDYGDSPLAQGAISLLAAAYESSGDLVKAAETYARARERARYDFQKVEALMNEARVHAAQGDANKAASMYRQVGEEFPDSPLAPEARVRLAELTATPLGGRKEPEPQAERPDSIPEEGGRVTAPAAPGAGSNVSQGTEPEGRTRSGEAQ